MEWFGKKRREKERAERRALAQDLERANEAIMALSARLNCAEAFIMALLETNDPIRKATVLAAARDFVVKLGDLKPPAYISAGKEQAFRNELSRALQVFIQIAETPRNSN